MRTTHCVCWPFPELLESDQTPSGLCWGSKQAWENRAPQIVSQGTKEYVLRSERVKNKATVYSYFNKDDNGSFINGNSTK